VPQYGSPAKQPGCRTYLLTDDKRFTQPVVPLPFFVVIPVHVASTVDEATNDPFLLAIRYVLRIDTHRAYEFVVVVDGYVALEFLLKGLAEFGFRDRVGAGHLFS
jgi:hypothetical protein